MNHKFQVFYLGPNQNKFKTTYTKSKIPPIILNPELKRLHYPNLHHHPPPYNSKNTLPFFTISKKKKSNSTKSFNGTYKSPPIKPNHTISKTSVFFM
ncbi:hypothetical protein L6452_33650 [Arctium lappa]|uniref:Uncharacterized protein n=1 Tax=Arctium lappa TaxID=4217 RepID=A0ACB8YG26_ARCLA|nr:hypothetical protein L6452_33650 [Arctium lappa]